VLRSFVWRVVKWCCCRAYSLFRCTLNAVPNTQSLLNKSRLPLGILLHPFKDLTVSKPGCLVVIVSGCSDLLTIVATTGDVCFYSNCLSSSRVSLSVVARVGRTSIRSYNFSTRDAGSATCAFGLMIVSCFF
jgi:hypothetical protein